MSSANVVNFCKDLSELTSFHKSRHKITSDLLKCRGC